MTSQGNFYLHIPFNKIKLADGVYTTHFMMQKNLVFVVSLLVQMCNKRKVLCRYFLLHNLSPVNQKSVQYVLYFHLDLKLIWIKNTVTAFNSTYKTASTAHT